jgi:hypothetical protein
MQELHWIMKSVDINITQKHIVPRLQNNAGIPWWQWISANWQTLVELGTKNLSLNWRTEEKMTD